MLPLTRVEAEKLRAAGNPKLARVAAWAVHDPDGRDAQEVVRSVADVIATSPDARLRALLAPAMNAR